MTDTLVKLVSV